ncbi:MAG: thermonuclease family protein [Gammaproteobacteria bacterium]
MLSIWPKFCSLVIILCLLGGCESGENRTATQATSGERLENVVVDHVKDGDSFRAIHNGQKIEVRLFGIDAPERDQPHADESKKMAVKLMGKSSMTLLVKDRDRYKRIVAEAYVDGQAVSVNQRLVESGAVWVYRQYTDSPSLIAAEKAAAKDRRGLWALPESKRIPPWVLRERNRNQSRK